MYSKCYHLGQGPTHKEEIKVNPQMNKFYDLQFSQDKNQLLIMHSHTTHVIQQQLLGISNQYWLLYIEDECRTKGYPQLSAYVLFKWNRLLVLPKLYCEITYYIQLITH